MNNQSEQIDEANAQSSAHFGNRNIEYLFERANAFHEEIVKAEKTALLKARRAGNCLIEAKKEVKRRHGRWLHHLKTRFKGSVRKAQTYMEIASGWPEIEIALKEHPDLSIDGALRFLRTGSVEPKPSKKFDIGDFVADWIWSEALKETWKGWTDTERDALRFTWWLFQDAMEELRLRNLQMNFQRGEWRRLLGKKQFETMKAREREKMKKMMWLRLMAQGAGIDSARPAPRGSIKI